MENKIPNEAIKTASSKPEKNKPTDHSKIYLTVAIAISAIFLAILIFAGGVAVGLRKARFSYSFGQNYERNFVGMREPGHGDDMFGNAGPGFRNSHGLAGAILSITGNNIVVKDQSGQENTVTISDKTLIKYQGNNLKVDDLKQNEQVVVLGRPSASGTVSADLIRVFDNLPQNNNNDSAANNPASSPNNTPSQPAVNNNQETPYNNNQSAQNNNSQQPNNQTNQ